MSHLRDTSVSTRLRDYRSTDYSKSQTRHRHARRHGERSIRDAPSSARSASISAQSRIVTMITTTMESWDDVWQAAARLQELIPDAVLVGGTAAAHHAHHRISLDDDHVVADLASRFDDVLTALEDTDGWVTARVKRPVMILGRLDGVETGIRNLIRRRPLEVEEVEVGGRSVRVPTVQEITRIKAWLCLMRNATRDYIDFAALADRLGADSAADVVWSLDEYYDDQVGSDGRRIATQAAKQLAEPAPDDLNEVDLSTYRQLDRRWHTWDAVVNATRGVALRVLDRAAGGAS